MKTHRRLRRFFSSKPLKEVGQRITLSSEESHHIRNTLRLRAGEYCLLTDGHGQESKAEIQKYTESGPIEVVLNELTTKTNPPGPFYLCAMPALCKKDVVDTIVEKLQELGIQECQPVVTERSTIRVSADKKEKVLARWTRKAQAASKQSGQTQLIGLYQVETLKQAVSQFLSSDLVGIFHPCDESISIKEFVCELETQKQALQGSRPRVLRALFGPEGGFSKREIDWLSKELKERQITYYVVGMGSGILRAETAVVSAMAGIQWMVQS